MIYEGEYLDLDVQAYDLDHVRGDGGDDVACGGREHNMPLCWRRSRSENSLIGWLV